MQPLGDSVASLIPVSLVAKDDSNILDKGSTADVDKMRKQQCAENTIIQKQAILEELQVTILLSYNYKILTGDENKKFSRKSFTRNVWDLSCSGLTVCPEFR
jgi:hypothetical protein